MNEIQTRARNIIYGLSVNVDSNKYLKNTFHLDYEQKEYREDALIKLIRDTVPFFALTPQELNKLDSNTMSMLLRRAWGRISNRPKEKKGDYGELLLFLLLEVFYPAKKLITKVRLRSSFGDEIKGFDCAHFSIKNDDIELWLGEAKFHQSFSTAISKAIESIEEHNSIQVIKDELIIIEGNNNEIDPVNREKIEKYLNSGLSIDKVKIKFPILITYDCQVVGKYESVSDEFISALKDEIQKKYQSIENRSIIKRDNVDLVFILLPLKSVSHIKEELEKIEKANK